MPKVLFSRDNQPSNESKRKPKRRKDLESILSLSANTLPIKLEDLSRPVLHVINEALQHPSANIRLAAALGIAKYLYAAKSNVDLSLIGSISLQVNKGIASDDIEEAQVVQEVQPGATPGKIEQGQQEQSIEIGAQSQQVDKVEPEQT